MPITRCRWGTALMTVSHNHWSNSTTRSGDTMGKNAAFCMKRPKDIRDRTPHSGPGQIRFAGPRTRDTDKSLPSHMDGKSRIAVQLALYKCLRRPRNDPPRTGNRENSGVFADGKRVRTRTGSFNFAFRNYSSNIRAESICSVKVPRGPRYYDGGIPKFDR